MPGKSPHPENKRHLALLLPFLAVPVALLWRPDFFFIADDWTALLQMVENPFSRYLVLPDGEQWFPFFHLLFYGLVKGVGERYPLYVLVNCLGTGVNAFLLFLFFRRHWPLGLSLALALFYAGAAVHHAIAWNAFYFSYLLSLGFFLGALLLTDSYCRAPSWGHLLGLGLCAGLSVLSHNYTLLGLLALPLYAGLLGGPGARGRARVLWALVALILTAFALGYLAFAGLPAAATHNREILSRLPGFGYLLHIICGALLAPFYYLLWGHFHFPLWAYGGGLLLLLASAAVIWGAGAAGDRRLALFALLLNLLPFLLISLARYQRGVDQAFVARYGVFTLIGALLLVGTAWRLLAARLPRRPGTRLLPLGVLALLVFGQWASLPRWRADYRAKSRAAATCYAELKKGEETAGAISPGTFQLFCPTAHPRLSRSQVRAIHHFLTGEP